MRVEDRPSLPEVHRTVGIPARGSWLRRLFAFAGPAYLVSVGYMDPGNWATDLAGGSRFGYQLVWVLLMSNIMAVVLQTLAARLGVVTGKDLAQACRDFYPSLLAFPLWVLCEVAIIACDLAEVLGSAVGMKLLFGIPLILGVLITALDVLILLGLSRFGMRRMEAFIVTLVATVGICFGIEIVLSRPDLAAIFKCFIPRSEDGTPALIGRAPDGTVSFLGLHGESLFIAIGILGATVMPHNLYLHSSLVQSRDTGTDPEGKRQACRMNFIDSVVALNCAFFVNAAILILAGTVFHQKGLQVERLEHAHQLLTDLLGSAAPVLFAVALLCSGQSSTITGTLAGQVVMEGFLRIRIRPYLRRLISRGLAVIPAALVINFQGESAVDQLLVLSQVVLSLQLSFAVIPLIHFTSDRSKMGAFANSRTVVVFSTAIAAVILGLNAKLAYDTLGGWFRTAEPFGVSFWLLRLLVAPGIGVAVVLLLFVILAPFLKTLTPWMVRPVTGGLAGTVHVPPIPVDMPALSGQVRPLGYRRIAVALEMGPADPAVMDHVVRLALSTGAELVLLHVAESAASRYLGDRSSDLESREDRAALEDLGRKLRERGLKVSVMLGHGSPQEELPRMVLATEPDILVTGSHGHRLLQDILLGATVSGVRHRVSVPVLTIPSKEPETAPPPPTR